MMIIIVQRGLVCRKIILSEFLSWHIQAALSGQALHVVLDHLVLLGDLFYPELQADQAVLVHPMDKKRKVILTLESTNILVHP